MLMEMKNSDYSLGYPNPRFLDYGVNLHCVLDHLSNHMKRDHDVLHIPIQDTDLISNPILRILFLQVL